jgi:4-carboxymuconolactone decarboxylase
MSRIQGLPAKRAGILAQLLYYFSQRRFGRVPEPVRVMAHHATLLGGYAGFEVALERSHRVPTRLKDLVDLRAATLIGCPF